MQLRPQLQGLTGTLTAVAQTPRGPVTFKATPTGSSKPSQKGSAAIDKILLPEILQRELVLAGKEQRGGVSSIGKASESASLRHNPRHGLHQSAEHDPVSAAQRFEVIHRNRHPGRLLLRIEDSLE